MIERERESCGMHVRTLTVASAQAATAEHFGIPLERMPGGEIDCHCGYDLCVCLRRPTLPCPDC